MNRKHAKLRLLVLISVLLSFGQAPVHRDESLTVSATLRRSNHHLETDYFYFGEYGSFHARRGTDLYRWMELHQDNEVMLTVKKKGQRELSWLIK